MPEKRTTVSEAEEVELEFKRLQIETMREQIQAREERKMKIQARREKALAEQKKGDAERARRQRICKHRKGGRDNKFANGNDPNYSVITNTYPTGRICVMCTRCGKEVWRPEVSLKKSDPEEYKRQMAEFKEWANFPTDNTPSGGKVFEISAA